MTRYLTEIVKATSTTEVLQTIERLFHRQIVVKNLEATGAHANSKLSFYVPRPEFEVKLQADITAVATTLTVPVDTAGGHVVRGHTMTTNDFLLISTSSGLAIKAISNVADNAGEDYCTLTIVATGKALSEDTKLFVVRAADVFDLTVGNASIAKTEVCAGFAGCPLVISATSGDATDTVALVTMELIEV